MRSIGLFFWMVMCVLPYIAHAAPSPLETQKQRLERVQNTLKTTQTEHALSQAQARRLQHEIAIAQEDILTKAAAINKVEQELASQEEEVRDLFEKEAKKSHDLITIRYTISRMVSAAWSIQYRPQLAAWLLPEETRERALASRALHMTTLSLKKQMDAANESMLEVQHLRASIVEKQRATEATQQRLQGERKTLQDASANQQRLLTQLQQHDAAYSQKITQLTNESKSLEGLIGKLETARTERDARVKHNQAEEKARLSHKALPPTIPTARESGKATSFALAKGRLPLPAEGSIRGTFGERRGNNDRLKGLEISTIKGALVTAPYEGEVLYTGTFLEYGKMVIIRHSREYHTLVAGLSRIDVSVGQFLLDGEPIGAMGESSNQRNLYLELRKSSQAIDPEPWFSVKKHSYAKR
jgi:murein hydrolase activator